MASLPQWAHWQVANRGQIIATGKDYLLTRVVAVARVQAAVEDGLLTAVGALASGKHRTNYSNRSRLSQFPVQYRF